MSRLKKATEYVEKKLKFKGETAIILGSGLGNVSDGLSKKKKIEYAKIPFYPKSTIKGHAGELVTGEFGGKEILIANGRFHLYEGYSENEISFPFNVFKNIGVKNIIITNSSGSLNKKNSPGTLMAINGHLDFTFKESYKNPEKIKGEKYYSPKLLKLAKEVSIASNIKLAQGIYCWTFGPLYETASEVSYFQSLGGNAVGMSGVPEIKICSAFGFSILVISSLTNYGAGISKEVLNHGDVLLSAMKNKQKLIQLLLGIIERI